MILNQSGENMESKKTGKTGLELINELRSDEGAAS
jgi:hypothetical protein